MFQLKPNQKESDMNATIVAVDLAKSIFEIAAAGADWRIGQRSRLPRASSLRGSSHNEPCQVVMEACGSAHYWARRIRALGRTVRLLPAHYVKAYVRRNKTDRADAGCSDRSGALRGHTRSAGQDSRGATDPVAAASAAQPMDEHPSAVCEHIARPPARVRSSIPLGVNVAKDRIGTALADPRE